MIRPLVSRWLGRLPYGEALAIQERLVGEVREGESPDTLLLLEHPPVITLGRSARREHVVLSEGLLASRGIEVHEVGRGGDVTYHGPGQLVGYPIVALRDDRRDVRRYARDLEQALIATAAAFGIDATRIPGLTGVWVGERKLAAVGVRISADWITSHGFAMNVGFDLSGFDAIVPCGIADKGVTSVALEGGHEPPIEDVAACAAMRVAEVLGAALSSPEPDAPGRRDR